MHFSTLFLNWNISWSSDAHWLRVCLWVHMGVFCEVNARFCFWMPLGHWYRVMNFSKKNWANPKFSGKKCKNHKSVCITKKDNNPTKRMICGQKNICFPTYFAVLSGWTFIFKLIPIAKGSTLLAFSALLRATTAEWRQIVTKRQQTLAKATSMCFKWSTIVNCSSLFPLLEKISHTLLDFWF